MADTPYPNFAPNVGVLDSTGGFKRYCYVLEILSIGDLPPARRAQLEDALGIVLEQFVDVEKHDLVRSERFVTDLRKALHVS
jgi:hypothetical protein